MARTRILVVDDEPDILELVQYNLSKAQYDVVGVESGEEALAQVRTRPLRPSVGLAVVYRSDVCTSYHCSGSCT